MDGGLDLMQSFIYNKLNEYIVLNTFTIKK